MTLNLKNLLNPKVKMSKMGEFQELQHIAGLEISAVSADLYGDGRDDLTLFYFKEGANFAGVYTTSRITSASINWNLKIKRHFVKALMVNTKNANVFTGIKGAQGLKEIAQALAKALTLKSSQSPRGVSEVVKITDLLFASTGVIGEDFPYLKIKNRIPELVKKLKAEQNKFIWFKAASALMTTDTRPKVAYEETKIGNKLIKISGIAKGSGMIAPSMATMLSFIFTDANIPSVFLKAILKKVTATTFNSITVDSDTSTNDMVGIFATGKAKNLKIYNVLDPKLQDFERALHRLCLNLAKQIIVDGEGAKKFITVNVIGARSTAMAKNVAFSIANSPLVKTAIAGGDPNWGRIIMACGKSGENIIANKIQLKIGNYLVVEQSKAAKDYKESVVKEYLKWDSIDIEVNLNIGSSLYTVYTCDFTHDYIVRDNRVQIIDEFTGRALEGRRFSDGLHQALEAKEKVEIQSENQTLASITYQNYFRLYDKIAGMTGTAATEAEEFYDIYKLKTVSVPTNKPMIRIDLNDQIYRTAKEKNKAIIEKIENCRKNNQPVLVGTVSIEKSEKISLLLNKKKIHHNVLNAKQHEMEAKIIAEAGKLGSVTIATNMAGRGTDIQLGGNLNYLNKELEKKKELILKEKSEVIKKGGLFVIGTERHESRRIDNQLRGRSGRQGDPGNSIFYISLEDDLMRIFGSESIDTIMKKFGLKENESIDHPWINKALERAQQRVEARNFDIRKTLLKFDDVMNNQRKVIFEQRKKILKSNDTTEIINSFLENLIKDFLREKTIYMRENQLDAFKAKIKPVMGKSFKDEEFANIMNLDNKEFEDIIKKRFDEYRNKRSKAIQVATNLELEKRIFLQTVDFLWRSHLHYLEHLRQVVGLRGYAQKDPLEEFKREAFRLFESLLNKIKIDFITFLNNLEIVNQEEAPIRNSNLLKQGLENNPKCLLVMKKNEKISRNEKCPATGKKYKHCCGAL